MLYDKNKLSRNYAEQPQGVREGLNYDDIYYLYWECNLTKKQVAKIIGCSDVRIYKFAKEHNLIKTQEMITLSQKGLMKELYGVDNYMKTEQGKKTCTKKVQQAFKEHKEEIVAKRKETYFKNTGYTNPSQNPDVKKKKEETCLKHFNTKNPQQCEEVKQKLKNTFEEKYQGNPLSSKSTIYESKVIKGIEDKYGCKNAMQNKEIAQKTAKTLKENQEIYKQNNLKKYGVEYPAQLEDIINKIDNSKKRNKTYNTSKDEKMVYKMLCEKFDKNFVKTQHKTDEYPFKCDFYIIPLDLYIEYQGTWRHGKQPFDMDNESCLNKYIKWVIKAETSENYQNAIETWTIRDVKKRETAKKNKLNWIEFFNMKEFMEWYNRL